MIRVLFVCLGNICRSTMAEGVFQRKVREAGLAGEIEVDSAGTGSWHIGESPHHGTMRTLAKNEITDYVHRGRQFSKRDFEAFDYILTMDEMNYADVVALGSGRATVTRFLDYAPQTGLREVPDPYFTGQFDEVYDLVTAAAEGLLKAICEEQGYSWSLGEGKNRAFPGR